MKEEFKKRFRYWFYVNLSLFFVLFLVGVGIANIIPKQTYNVTEKWVELNPVAQRIDIEKSFLYNNFFIFANNLFVQFLIILDGIYGLSVFFPPLFGAFAGLFIGSSAFSFKLILFAILEGINFCFCSSSLMARAGLVYNFSNLKSFFSFLKNLFRGKHLVIRDPKLKEIDRVVFRLVLVSILITLILASVETFWIKNI